MDLFGSALNIAPVEDGALEELRRRAFQRYAELYNARNRQGANQQRLSSLEHGAFAESAVLENPLMALPLIFATPAYAAAKSLGLHPSRTGPSIDQMAESYRGIGRGLMGYFGQ